jgi:hypothetical protein
MQKAGVQDLGEVQEKGELALSYGPGWRPRAMKSKSGNLPEWLE